MSENDLIYLLEDEPDVASVFCRALEGAGVTVQHYRRLQEFRSALQQRRPILCIIDLGLPDGDGLSLLGEALGSEGIPTIVVSGRVSLSEKLKGLEQGADDYMAKPIDPAELVARVRCVLRRTQRQGLPQGREDGSPGPVQRQVGRFGRWTCDFRKLVLTRPDGVAQQLSRADAELLRVFLDTQGRVISRDFLLQSLFSNGEEPFDRSVDVRVSRLRKKLAEDSNETKHIRTIYGVGYIFATAVTWTSE